MNQYRLNAVPLVGIGASAGGLEALEQFFKNMPKKNGMAFIVIQHLDPHHVGIMPELLQRISSMQVQQVTDQIQLLPDNIYVIPPNKNLSVLKGRLHLFERNETRRLQLPIDIFFRSLADDRQQNSVGIILSGMGSDGSLGLKAIKEKNGLVLVQDPASAKFSGMPQSAIEAVIPDVIAPANKLPEKLIECLNHYPKTTDSSQIRNTQKSNLEKIIILIRERTGHDFSLYKKTTLIRRIERRMSVHQIEKIHNYVRFIQGNPMEIEILFKEFLIGVTNFFRDNSVWEKLETKIIPELIEQDTSESIFRAWIPGCSTGEEAYSLAITFTEVAEKVNSFLLPRLQIFATDIDEDAINYARKGYFPKNISADVTKERLNRFFNKERDGYRVKNAIRDMIVFAPQDVSKDPPFTKIDILSCRNMLIYMEPELQNLLISLFGYSLNMGGILMLGTAETLGKVADKFEILDSKSKVFKLGSRINPSVLVNFPKSNFQSKTMIEETPINQKKEENIQTLADQIVLQRFAPSSVLVTENGDIVYISGRTGKYIEPPAGKANWNIHAMAREGLRFELPGAFRRALKTPEPIELNNLKIGDKDSSQLTDVTVQQIESPDALKGMFIVVFKEATKLNRQEVTEKSSKTVKSTGKEKMLEEELQRTFKELQHTREERQASEEELKSMNEELQSTNEELQSNNEELTTSKEEMQSLNEELQTVNLELENKVVEFERVSDDMKNLLNGVDIATLFLDKQLNIRRFTDMATNIFKIRDTDVGRPFTDLVSKLNYAEIESDARRVLKLLTPVEKEIESNDREWHKVKIMPYRTVDDRIDGLVLTFNDITISKKLEIELKKANEKLRTKT